MYILILYSGIEYNLNNLNSLYITYSQTTTYQPSRHYTLALHTTTRLLASCELLPPHATYATHPPTVNSHSHPLFYFLFFPISDSQVFPSVSQVHPKRYPKRGTSTDRPQRSGKGIALLKPKGVERSID